MGNAGVLAGGAVVAGFLPTVRGVHSVCTVRARGVIGGTTRHVLVAALGAVVAGALGIGTTANAELALRADGAGDASALLTAGLVLAGRAADAGGLLCDILVSAGKASRACSSSGVELVLAARAVNASHGTPIGLVLASRAVHALVVRGGSSVLARRTLMALLGTIVVHDTCTCGLVNAIFVGLARFTVGAHGVPVVRGSLVLTRNTCDTRAAGILATAGAHLPAGTGTAIRACFAS